MGPLLLTICSGSQAPCRRCACTADEIASAKGVGPLARRLLGEARLLNVLGKGHDLSLACLTRNVGRAVA